MPVETAQRGHAEAKPPADLEAPAPESKEKGSPSPETQQVAGVVADEAAPQDHSRTPYSAFTTRQKKWLVFIAALAGWFSTASSFIYFPAIPFLARDLDVSVEKINLTVTSYLVASGVFPSIAGNAADRYGRRPIFLASIGLYVAVNVGLALQRSFAALITLRMLQSVAISGTFSFAYGVLGDVTTPANRGAYIGFMSVFLNTPPSVAPLISGLLLIRWDWSSIFWFLCIASSVVLLAILLFLPETCRRLVGDGSIRASPLTSTALVPLLSRKVKHESAPRLSTKESRLEELKQVVNPFACFALLKKPGTAIAVLCYGVYYTVYSCTQASLSTIFVDVYGVSGLVAGLSYIPFGAGCIIASFLAGKLLDFDYRRTARSLGRTVDRRKEDNLATFPIEYARFRTSKWVLAVCGPLIAGYGWALEAKVHIAVPLVLQFWIGFTNQINFTSLNAVLVDYHPDRPSTVQAASNLFRCEFAAGGLALLDVMLRSLGPGWCFVVWAALHMLTLPTLWLAEIQGLSWRQSRK